MKNPFEHLDKVLEHRIRLQVMSVLVTQKNATFNDLKELLQVTDGNLASNVKALEKEKYLSVLKSFKNRKPHTEYKATERGKQAFRKHLDALEGILKQQKN